MTLFGSALSFMREYPRPSMYGSGLPDWKDGVDNWHGMCGQFCWRLADYLGWEPEPTGSVETAQIVADGSGWLNTNWRKAPAGAWHFWSGLGDGHVIFDTLGGGTTCVEGYNNPATSYGAACGVDSVEGVDQKLNLHNTFTYLGWATNYAGGRIRTTASAGSGTVTPIIEKDKDMPRILKTTETNDGNGKVSNGRRFFDGPGGIKHIANESHLGLLERYLKDDSPFFFAGEWGIINSYLTAPAPSIDPAPLSAAVTKAVTAALASVKVTVDESRLTASVAAAVDATLADDFASVKATIPKGFTITPIKG